MGIVSKKQFIKFVQAEELSTQLATATVRIGTLGGRRFTLQGSKGDYSLQELAALALEKGKQGRVTTTLLAERVKDLHLRGEEAAAKGTLLQRFASYIKRLLTFSASSRHHLLDQLEKQGESLHPPFQFLSPSLRVQLSDHDLLNLQTSRSTDLPKGEYQLVTTEDPHQILFHYTNSSGNMKCAILDDSDPLPDWKDLKQELDQQISIKTWLGDVSLITEEEVDSLYAEEIGLVADPNTTDYLHIFVQMEKDQYELTGIFREHGLEIHGYDVTIDHAKGLRVFLSQLFQPDGFISDPLQLQYHTPDPLSH